MAVRFDGNSADSLTKDIAFSADLGSVAAWAKLSVDRNNWSALIELRASQLILLTDADGTTLRLWDASVNNAGATLTAGTWVHLAVITSGTSHTVYVNGVLNITGAAVSRTWTKVMLGNDSFSEPFNGCLAAVKAWNAALTVNELQNEMRQYEPRRFANLVGFWPILPGGRTADYSTNGNAFTDNGTNTDEEGPPIPWKLARSRYVLPTAAAAPGGLSIPVAMHNYRRLRVA